MVKARVVLLLLCLLMVAVPAFAQEGMMHTVNIGGTDDLGAFLVGPEGKTLYLFTRDPLDESVCYDQCAERWIPLTVESADALSADPAIPGEFGTTERTDGALQVTYNGAPLYYWFADAEVGSTSGQGVGGVWWVVPPGTVAVSDDTALGSVLVGPTGMTLYKFMNDEPGVSNCYDQCAASWPPLTVESADDLLAGVGVHGELGTTERTDGTLQVTYNGMPLYYWIADTARGDVLGENVGEVWFTIVPETVLVANSADLGDFLTTPAGMTLYIFDNDEAGVSNCADQCATNWPPYTIGANERLAAPQGASGELDTIERADGTRQVTYNGAPLYGWQGDVAPGDTTGQGVGDVWWVAAP